MSEAPAFNRVALIVLVAAGLVSAAAFTLLTAYAPDLASSHAGGGHALSRAATGYSAIVDLARASGTATRLSRDDRPGDAGLLILTPEAATDPKRVDRLVRARDGAPTLIVLPKWNTTPVAVRPQWVETHGLIDAPAAALAKTLPGIAVATRAATRGERLSAPGVRGVAFAAPATVATFAAPGVDAVVTTAAGEMVLGWQSKNEVYVLADPDLLDNAGMRDLAAARAAVALLRDLGGARPGGIVFDVTLNGFGGGRDLLKLMLEPPFLGLTLALMATAALAIWQACVRFGTPTTPGRAIAFGKAALIDNIAALIATARREAAIAPRYAALVAARVAASRHAPSGLDERDLAAWLDRLGGSPRFSVLAHDATLVDNPAAALASARALYRWQKEAVHDR